MAIKKSELYRSLWSSCAEANIRRNLVRQGFIGLPANLFYGTGILACIIVLDKHNAQARRSIFMIEASRGIKKDRNKNRLGSQDLHKRVDVFNRQTALFAHGQLYREANDYAQLASGAADRAGRA